MFAQMIGIQYLLVNVFLITCMKINYMEQLQYHEYKNTYVSKGWRDKETSDHCKWVYWAKLFFCPLEILMY